MQAHCPISTWFFCLWPEVHCICQSCWFQLYLYLQCSKIISHNMLVIHTRSMSFQHDFFAGCSAQINILSLNTNGIGKPKYHGNLVSLLFSYNLFLRLYYIPQILRFFQNVWKMYRRLNEELLKNLRWYCNRHAQPTPTRKLRRVNTAKGKAIFQRIL
jgi:hypothetical protein